MTSTRGTTTPGSATPGSAVPGIAIRRRRRPAAPYILLIPAVAALLVGLGYPVYWQVVTSLQQYGMMQQFGAPPTFVGLDNYVEIFTDPEVWAVVGRSIAFCLFNAVATVTIGLLLAVLMRAVHTAVRLTMQVTMLLAWATPLVAAVTVFRWLFDERFGVVNYLLTSLGLDGFARHDWLQDPLSFFLVASMIVIWMSVPFVAMSIYAGLTQVSEEVLEAARLDGAGPRKILWLIIMPLVRPVVAIVLLLQIIWDLRVFAQIQLLQDGGANIEQTNLLGNYIYQVGVGSQQFGTAAAVSIFVLVLTVVLAGPYVRYLMKEDAA